MGVVQLGPKTNFSPQDVINLWVDNGGDPSKAPIAAAIVFSTENPSGNAGLVNDNPATQDYSVGLWQINYFGGLLAQRTSQFGSPEALASDPNLQAKAAISLSQNGQNWQPWATADMGYPDYSQPVPGPLPGSRVANWLEKNGYALSFPLQVYLKPLALAASSLLLASLIANAISPRSVWLPKALRASS